MGKIKPSTLCSFDVKPLIPNNKDKFSRPPKKKKFRLKLRFNQHKVKSEKKSKPIIPFTVSQVFHVKKEHNNTSDFYVKPEPRNLGPKLPQRRDAHMVAWESSRTTEDFDCTTDPTYTPSDEFAVVSSDDDSAYFEVLPEQDDVLRIKPVNADLKHFKVKKEKKIKKTKKKPRRRYKRRVLSDSEKLQASRRRRTCLVKKPKSEFLGVSWCNTKNTWVARVWHPTERKLIWAGYHQNERACALAVNEKCLDLKIPLKNPHIVGHWSYTKCQTFLFGEWQSNIYLEVTHGSLLWQTHLTLILFSFFHKKNFLSFFFKTNAKRVSQFCTQTTQFFFPLSFSCCKFPSFQGWFCRTGAPGFHFHCLKNQKKEQT